MVRRAATQSPIGLATMPAQSELSTARTLAAQTALMLLGNVEIVEGVTLHLLDGQIRKSGFRQELQCLLFAPHRAETFAVSRQRDRHAMHGRNRIQKRPHGMVEILLHIA